MVSGLLIIITICVSALLAIIGVYAYRYCNNLLLNSQTGWEIFFYTLLLIAVCGAFFIGGFLAIAYIYDALKVK